LKKKVIQPFHFKEFSVQQEKCSMKVGTDGVLLGAWVDLENCKTALDVGTGSGLIALMITQRNSLLHTIAIDIDKNSFEQAYENFEMVSWKKRLFAQHSSLQNLNLSHKMDLIISNPPFFSKSLKSEKHQKNIARHDDNLTFEEIVFFSHQNLSDVGKLVVIYPIENETDCNKMANAAGLFLTKCCYVKPLPDKPAKRIMLEYTFQKKEIIISELIVEVGQRHQYSDDYKRLTKEFYIGF
jgi:tRNA1Val (adenine37-N6)-methyltransferase